MSAAASRATVFAGGPILTVADPSTATPARVDALAVRDGRIVQVGTLEDARTAAGRDAAERDLGGSALIPGFVDPHIHPLMYGQTSAWIDVSASVAPSIAKLVETLAAGATRVPDGTPVRGYGYDLRRLAERRHPNAAELDRAAPGRPVEVMHASGHGGAVNSVALARAGIDATTPDPPGGEIGRDADGKPNGMLMDAAWDLLAGRDGVRTGRHGPNIHAAEDAGALARHLEHAQRVILEAGITSVCDAQVTRRELETYLRLRDAGTLRMRVDILVLSSLLDEVLALGLVRPLGDAGMRFAGIKLYSDGTLVGRTAWFPDGYPGAPDEHGLLYHSPEELRELLGRAHAAGLQTATHSLSSAAIGLVLDAVETAQRRHPRPDMRHRIEHCALPDDAQIARMGRLGVVPVAQSQHARLYGDGAIAAVGREQGERYHPLGAYAQRGVRFALSSDAPVAEPAPLEAIQAAVERTTVLGTVLDGEELRVTATQALRACTLDAAWACHREAEIGSLEAGKLADLAILSADPTAAEVGSISKISVLETWIGGEPIGVMPG